MKEFRILVGVVVYALTEVIEGETINSRFSPQGRGVIKWIGPFSWGNPPVMAIAFYTAGLINTNERRRLSIKQGLSEFESVPLNEQRRAPHEYLIRGGDESTSSSEEIQDPCTYRTRHNDGRRRFYGERTIRNGQRHSTSDFLNNRSLHIPRKFMVKNRGRKSLSHGDDKGARSLSQWGVPRMMTGGKVFRRRK